MTVSDNAASVEFVVGEEEPVEVSVVSRERGGEELLVNLEFVQTDIICRHPGRSMVYIMLNGIEPTNDERMYL